MPEFVSIVVESPNHYLAVDEAGRIWNGEGGRTPGAPMVISWERVISEFPGSSESKSSRVTFKVTGPQRKGRRKGTITLQPSKKGRREED